MLGPEKDRVSRCWLLVPLLLSLVGCAGRFGRAVHSYEESRFPDAMATFRSMETEEKDWSEDEQTRYALYRGLTHLAVGDARAASHWLGLAKRATERKPKLLSVSDQERLTVAWRALGYMPGENSRY